MMIKRPEFFKSKRSMALFTGIFCMFILGGLFLVNTSGPTAAWTTGKYTPSDWKVKSQPSETIKPKDSLQKQEKPRYDAEKLIQSKTKYVGNASAVVKLIDNLPLANFRKNVSLKTDTRPYGITVKYNLGLSSLSTDAIDNILADNATLLLALIDNVDEIIFQDNISQKEIARFNRAQIQSGYDKDLRDYSKNEQAFLLLLNSLELKLYASPPRYMLAMSSTPGIRVSAHYNGPADKVKYSISAGRLFGKTQDYGLAVELPYNTPVYWSPAINETIPKSSDIWIKATLIKDNVPLADRLLHLSSDDSIIFNVEAAPDVILGNPDNPRQVVFDYFAAFARADYDTMRSLSTDYHNQKLVHSGDVWGMKWARAKEIKYSGTEKGKLRFGVSVDMETVKSSAQYPSRETFFFIEVEKGVDGVWRIDNYTTG